VNPITNEVITYKEFAKSRQKYVYMQYPLTNFEKKEEKEKESVKQKIRKWYNNVKKPIKSRSTVTNCLMDRRLIS